MILFPPAKINLGLNILFKRDDGFHEIETCMCEIPLTDVLELLPADDFRFVQTGFEISDEGGANNLVVRAYDLMKEKYSIGGAYIHLRKNIPMGAGLGGGSADGAYALKGLNELFSLNLSVEELEKLAAELGSDCPFFIEGDMQLASGRGEDLSPIDIDLNGYYIKLINPGIHIGTAEAYAGVQLMEESGSLIQQLQEPVHTWRHSVKNDFEASIFQKHSALESIKNELYEEGAVYASMTGSGSTMFGLFTEEPTKSDSGLFEKILRF